MGYVALLLVPRRKRRGGRVTSLWVCLIVAAALLGILYAVFSDPWDEEDVNELMRAMQEEPHDR